MDKRNNQIIKTENNNHTYCEVKRVNDNRDCQNRKPDRSTDERGRRQSDLKIMLLGASSIAIATGTAFFGLCPTPRDGGDLVIAGLGLLAGFTAGGAILYQALENSYQQDSYEKQANAYRNVSRESREK